MACAWQKCLPQDVLERLPPSLPLGTLFSFSVPAALQLPHHSAVSGHSLPGSALATTSTRQDQVACGTDADWSSAAGHFDAGHKDELALVQNVQALGREWCQPGFGEKLWKVHTVQSCIVHQHVVL